MTTVNQKVGACCYKINIIMIANCMPNKQNLCMDCFIITSVIKQIKTIVVTCIVAFCLAGTIEFRFCWQQDISRKHDELQNLH